MYRPSTRMYESLDTHLPDVLPRYHVRPSRISAVFSWPNTRPYEQRE